MSQSLAQQNRGKDLGVTILGRLQGPEDKGPIMKQQASKRTTRKPFILNIRDNSHLNIMLTAKINPTDDQNPRHSTCVHLLTISHI